MRPSFENAVIDLAKLRDYVLNGNHPEGRHKARVFLSALGIAAADCEWLSQSIRVGLNESTPVFQQATEWGEVYRVDMRLARGRRSAKVRSAWLCSGNSCRLITCFVIGERDETA